MLVVVVVAVVQASEDAAAEVRNQLAEPLQQIMAQIRSVSRWSFGGQGLGCKGCGVEDGDEVRQGCAVCASPCLTCSARQSPNPKPALA